jgi:hypothetical protein
MSKLLLLGNSVNRLGNGQSWDEVIRALRGVVGVPGKYVIDGKPLPLVYEYLVCREGCDEVTAKRQVVQSMRELQFNWAHVRATELGCQNILTTNYDYCLEAASGLPSKNANLMREGTYSAYRRARIGEQFVWHIHGEANAPRSVLLGVHQYAGYLQKLRTYLTVSPKVSPFQRQDLEFDQSDKVFSWADLFLRDNVHIIGLTLDYVETHLWWLIAYKRRLKASGRRCGTTTYYYFYDADEAAPLPQRIEMLTDLGVATRVIQVKAKDYARAHREVFGLVESAAQNQR